MIEETVSPDKEIKAIFDRIAPVYDQLNNWLSFGQHRIWKSMAVKWSEPIVGGRGLDLCCGSGDLTELLAKQIGKNGEVIGVDFSPKQLATAKARASQEYPNYPINWIEADVLNLPFENNYFDCATMGYGLRNVTDIPLCLKELHRVLRVGAKAAILDFNHPDTFYLKYFQKWYLDNIVVSTARYFGLTEEYNYINPSLDRFPTGRQQIKLGYEAGFSSAIHYPIANDLMGVLVLKK
jgi:demethylmenaquinone methyltransferase/2-methoxy-6-polyprenyl-1,4-benzoquinol methylase